MADITLNHLDEANILDSVGMRNLPWKASTDNALAPSLIDVNWLVAQPLLPYLVKAIPSATLYRSLRAHGLQDSIEVIEWIRGKQLLEIFDYDIWSASSRLAQPEISAEAFLEWVRSWLDVDVSFAADRFSELEEEVIVALLSKFLIIEPEQITQLSDLQKDEFFKTPDGAYYLRLKNADNQESFEIIYQLIDALYKKNVIFAQSCLAHAAMLVRDESVEDALRWRAARLSEQGFVSTEDAVNVLRPRPVQPLLDELKSLKSNYSQSSLFNSEAYENSVTEIHNALLSQPEDVLQNEILNVLSGEEFLQLTGVESTQAESNPHVFRDEEMTIAAAEKIADKCRKMLSVFEKTKSAKWQDQKLKIEEDLQKIAEDDQYLSSNLKMQIARLSNAVASWNLPNQFPDENLQLKAALIVRGFLNIGLEKSGVSLRVAGPERLFKLGLSVTHDVICNGARLVEMLAQKKGHDVSFIRTLVLGRFTEIRHWLSQNEMNFDAGIFFVLNALFNKIPLFPKILEIEEVTHKVLPELRMVESLSDLEKIDNFFDSLANNISFRESL